MTGGKNGDNSAEKSIEVHDKDGQFRCELNDYLLLSTMQHTQTSYEYTLADPSNYLKFQVCGGSNIDASRTCQTYDDGDKYASPSLVHQRNLHISYSSSSDKGLVLLGGQRSPNTTEILRPGETEFEPYIEPHYTIIA